MKEYAALASRIRESLVELETAVCQHGSETAVMDRHDSIQTCVNFNTDANERG